MLAHRYGPWALVTGASSGIGHAFARHLAAAGIDVVLAARSVDRLRAIGEELRREHGVDHRVVGVDLATPGGATDLIRATDDLDVGLLVSNAGDGRPADFLDHDLAAHMANVAAAKGFVHHLGEALHHELAPAGIDVTVMMPGNVDTPIVGRIGLDRSDFPMPLMDADRAVTQAMRALASGSVRIVPGRAMRLGLALLPRRASVRLNGRLIGRALSRRAADGPQQVAA